VDDGVAIDILDSGNDAVLEVLFPGIVFPGIV
jgi:hypothetical protein